MKSTSTCSFFFLSPHAEIYMQRTRLVVDVVGSCTLPKLDFFVSWAWQLGPLSRTTTVRRCWYDKSKSSYQTFIYSENPSLDSDNYWLHETVWVCGRRRKRKIFFSY